MYARFKKINMNGRALCTAAFGWLANRRMSVGRRVPLNPPQVPFPLSQTRAFGRESPSRHQLYAPPVNFTPLATAQQ